MTIIINKLSNFSYSKRTLPIVPPSKPVVVPRWGEYCIKAEADILNEKNEKVGHCVGYSDIYGIVHNVTEACKVNTRRRKLKCGPTIVTILPKRCIRHGIFFEFFNKNK